jgi:hypothetical protein
MRLNMKAAKVKIHLHVYLYSLIKHCNFASCAYGCKTWSFTLGEEQRLRVFENRMLRKISGPKREEDGSWRKLHNDELHDLYSSPNIVRVIKSRRMRGLDMWHAWVRGEVLTGF